jgi:DNA-binding Lrp family transcriptional regulator
MSTRYDTAFGAPYAVLNLSKLGLRYFRFMIKASPASRTELVSHFVNHPNIGWIFSAEGWFNLAVGVWAKDNAEINDINSSIRQVLGEGDQIVYQSELTSLHGFGNRPVKDDGKAMPILDSVFNPVTLDSLELDYVKLLTLDSSIPDIEMAGILGVPEDKLKALRSGLEASGVIVGYQERLNYDGIYFKVFVDTLSAKNPNAERELTERLWNDQKCIYVERANGKYNLEFELILEHKSAIEDYVKDFSEYQTSILTENLYTNLYPLNKIANLKEIKDTLAGQKGSVIDFRNSKLWYLNYRGTSAYLSIYENKQYFESMNKSELDLFADVVTYIKQESSIKSYSVIDIGSGDGFKGRVFVERLGEENVKAYYPVDIQPIELAAALKAHEDGTYAKSPVLLDIENLSARFPLKLHPGEGQVYGFFGGTYGNFQSSVINSHLKTLVSDASAVVVISMPIRSNTKTDEQIIQTYTAKSVEDMAFGPLSQLGFTLEECEVNPAAPGLRLHVAMEDERIVTSFVLNQDKTVLGKFFEKGTVFKMTTSWKPTLEQVEAALSEDFLIKKVFHNDDMSITVIGAK